MNTADAWIICTAIVCLVWAALIADHYYCARQPQPCRPYACSPAQAEAGECLPLSESGKTWKQWRDQDGG